MSEVLIPNGGDTLNLSPRISVTLPQPIPENGVLHILRDNVVVGTATQLTTTSFSFVDTVTPDHHYIYTARLDINGKASKSPDYKITAISTSDQLVTLYYQGGTTTYTNGGSNADVDALANGYKGASTLDHTLMSGEPSNDFFATSSNSSKYVFGQNYSDLVKCYFRNDILVEGKPAFTQEFDVSGVNIPYITASAAIFSKSDIAEVLNTSIYASTNTTRSVYNYDNILGLAIAPIFQNLTNWNVGPDSEPIMSASISYTGWVIQITRTPIGWYFIINDGGVNFQPFSVSELAKEVNPGKLTATFTVTSIPTSVFYQTIKTASNRSYPIVILRGMIYEFGLPWPNQFSLTDLTINDFTGYKRVRQGTTFRAPLIPVAPLAFTITPGATQLVINSPFLVSAVLTGLRPNTECEVVVFHSKVAPPQGNGDAWPDIPRELVGFKTDNTGTGYLEVKITETDADVITSNFYCKLRYAGNLLEVARSNALSLSTEIVAPPLTFNPVVAWLVSIGEAVVRFPGDNLDVGGTVTGLLANTQYLIKYFLKPTLGSSEAALATANKISNSTGVFTFSTTLVVPGNALIGNNVCYTELWSNDGTTLHARSIVTPITINTVVAYNFSWTTTANPIYPGDVVAFTATITGLDANTAYYLRPRYNGNTISPVGENNGIHVTDQFGSLTSSVNAKLPSGIPLGSNDITCWLQANGTFFLVHESPATTITVVALPVQSFVFTWAMDSANVAAGNYVTGTTSITGGPGSTVFVFTGTIKDSSNNTLVSFVDQFISTNSSGVGNSTFSFKIPDGTPLGTFHMDAIGTIYGDSVTAFTATTLVGSVVVAPPVKNFGIVGNSILQQGGTVTLYGNIYNLLPSVNYTYGFRLASTSEGMSTLRSDTFTSDSNGAIDLSNFVMNIPAWQMLTSTRLFVELYGTGGNGAFEWTSPWVDVTVVDPTTLPLASWVKANGQANTVNENSPVHITGSVIRLVPNGAYNVTFSEVLVGVGSNQISYGTINADNSGTLNINLNTTLSRVGFFYGFYEGSTMRYNAIVSAQDGSYNVTTPYLDFVIGTLAAQPTADWQITGSTNVSIGDTIVVGGSVINLVANTTYSVFIRGRDSGYNDFTLFQQDVAADSQGILNAGVNMLLPNTAIPGWFQVELFIRVQGTYDEIITATVEYTVILIIPDLTLLNITGQGPDGSHDIVDTSPSVKTLGVQSATYLSTTNPPPGSTSSIAFNGTTNYIIAAGVVLDTGVPFSIETDLYLNNNSVGGFGSMGILNEDLYGISFLLGGGGTFLVRIGRVNSGGFTTVNGSGTLDAGTWYRIVIVKRNSSTNGVEIWVNNVLRGQGSNFGNYLTNTDFALGRAYPHGNNSFLDGKMANTKIKSGPQVLLRDYTVAPTVPLAFTWSLDSTTVKPGGVLTGSATLSNALPSTTYTFNGSIKNAALATVGTFASNTITTDGTGFGVATFSITVPSNVLEGALTLNATGNVSGNGTVVFTPIVLNATASYPNAVVTWAFVNGQSTTLNRGNSVEGIGSVTNLDASTSYRVVTKLGTVVLSDNLQLSDAAGILVLDSVVNVPNDTTYDTLDFFIEVNNAGATRTVNVTTIKLPLTVVEAIVYTDPYASSVVLQLRFEGADGSIVITDEANIGNVITVAGDAHISTTNPIYGASSLVLNAGHVNVAQSSYLDMTATDFTLEAIIYISAYPASGAYIFDKDGQAYVSYPQYSMSLTSAGKISAFLGNGAGVSPAGTTFTSAEAIPLNSKVHVVLVKYGTQCFGFINGVKQWSGTAPAMFDGGRPFKIGYELDQPANSHFVGKVDNVRLSKMARYTANFLPPVEHWAPAPDNTAIVIDLNGNSFLDASPNAVTFTALTGAPQSTAAIHAYSGLKSFAFTGTDALVATNAQYAFGDLPFSIEADIFFNGVESGGFGSLSGYTENVFGVSFWLTGGGSYRVRIGKSLANSFDDILGTTTLVTNTWYRVAIVKRSSDANGVDLRINGAVVATGTSSISITATKFAVGRVYPNDGGEYLNGNIANLLVTTGVGVLIKDYSYTGIDPRTFLSLVRFIGSGGSTVFPDEVGGINWSTIGSPVISTAQSKFGGSSLFLDSGAFISRLIDSSFGTGDFTMEGLFYPTSYGGGKMLFAQESGGISLAMSSTGYIQYSQAYVAVLANSSQNPVLLNQWNTVAISRSSNITTITVNGLVAISMVDNNNFSPASMYIGGYVGMSNPAGFTGYVGPCRALKGIGLRPGPYTPESKTFLPFTGASTEVLRISGDGVNDATNIVDSSLYANAVGVNGAKFSNLTPYPGTSTSVRVSGGDSLYVSPTPLLGFGTGDFTIELKVNVQADSGSGGYNFFDFRPYAGATPFTMYLKNAGGSNYIGVYSASGGAAMEWGNTVVVLNTWIKIVLQRAGGRWYCLINDTVLTFTRGDNTNANGDMGSNQPVTIGYGLQTLMRDIVINKGIALYPTS